jgi:hypothetical protein
MKMHSLAERKLLCLFVSSCLEFRPALLKQKNEANH